MNERLAFHWHVGSMLAKRLPYRKKGFLFGPQVCEWAAVLSMTKAAFFTGASLALNDQTAAEEVLDESVTLEKWRNAFHETIADLNQRAEQVDRLAVSYEALFPETMEQDRRQYTKALQSPTDCVRALGQGVLVGLIVGALFPDLARSMLQSWVGGPRGSRRLGVGGLSVDDSPLFSTVDEATNLAQNIYTDSLPCLRYHAGGVAEWTNATVLKTVVPSGTVGSNPTPSARPWSVN